MKIPLSLCLSLGLCVLAAAYARADDDDKPITPPHDPDINSPTYDGSTFNTGQSKKPTAAEIQARREAQQEEANWLVRGYEQQMKKESTAKDETDLSDPDARISFSTNPTDVANHHAVTDSAKTSSRQKPQPISGGGFKPLITPLSATDAAGLPNFYATLPAGAPAPVSANTSTPGTVSPATDAAPVTEMPGLTAAQSHPTQINWNDDLLGPLPDDSHNKQASESEDKGSNVLPQVPSGDAARQLQQTVLVTTTGKTTPQPTPVKVVIPPDPELIPQPVAVPILTAGRPQIQDPNDSIR